MDREVDEREIEVEEECLKILALHQPVAVDLRFLIAVIKINNELERIADQAKNISRRVKNIAKGASFEFEFDYGPVAEKAVSMVKQSLDSLVTLDGDLAYKVRIRDDEVDEAIQSAYQAVQQAIRKSPEHVNELINMFLISRHLERIADHSTNIAEEVIYLIEGEIVRHGKY
jgi:phosphate transport system protein